MARRQADRAGGPADLSREAASQPVGAHPSRVDWGQVPDVSGNGCQCRLCQYDAEFAEHIAFVPIEHRAFFDELKERWEATDFDAQWYQGCVGGEEYTVEFCQRYETELAKVTRRARDRDAAPRGREAAEAEGQQPGPTGIAQPLAPHHINQGQGEDGHGGDVQ